MTYEKKKKEIQSQFSKFCLKACESMRKTMATIASIFAFIVTCHSFSTSARPKTSIPLITPSTIETSQSSSQLQFDIGCVANPVVLPPCNLSDKNGEWQCYYYGNAGFWNGNRKCFLPTGSSGLAISVDGGITWSKVKGKNTDESMLSSSDDGSGEWDEVQTGVGDVIRIDKDELYMYYFGSSAEELSFGPGTIAGFRMRIGRAKSFDNGRTWTKGDGYLFDYDESEGLFASWPRIVMHHDDDKKTWSMYYHSFDGKKWRVYRAESIDKGDTQHQAGLILEGGKSEDDFDFSGIGTRSIVKWKDGYLMIYEGVCKDSKHRFGAAFSKDGKDKWVKMNNGKPILEPGKGPLGEWTKQVIGMPFVVNISDRSLKLFYCGKESTDSKMTVGVIKSKSGEIGPECWTAL